MTRWTVTCQAHSVHGVLQAKILEWVALSSSRGSSQHRDPTCISHVSCISWWVLYLSHPGSPKYVDQRLIKMFYYKCIYKLYIYKYTINQWEVFLKHMIFSFLLFFPSYQQEVIDYYINSLLSLYFFYFEKHQT